jgi:CubicO group peptidase (beta-lactamase class C family)
MSWPAHAATFGDLLSPRTYGHWGATGTMLWIDPERQAIAAILATQPLDPQSTPALIKLSNAITAAIDI